MIILRASRLAHLDMNRNSIAKRRRQRVRHLQFALSAGVRWRSDIFSVAVHAFAGSGWMLRPACFDGYPVWRSEVSDTEPNCRRTGAHNVALSWLDTERGRLRGWCRPPQRWVIRHLLLCPTDRPRLGERLEIFCCCRQRLRRRNAIAPWMLIDLTVVDGEINLVILGSR